MIIWGRHHSCERLVKVVAQPMKSEYQVINCLICGLSFIKIVVNINQGADER